MLLSREKAAISQSPVNRVTPAERAEPQEKPTIEGFFSKRDYTGALTLIEFELRSKKPSRDHTTLLKWKALTCVRIGNFEEAMRTYESILENVNYKRHSFNHLLFTQERQRPKRLLLLIHLLLLPGNVSKRRRNDPTRAPLKPPKPSSIPISPKAGR